jgi:dTDP-4-amino-4,6-dideoxygalactose transaminase
VKRISLVDLRVDGDEQRAVLDAVEQVLSRGWFLLGPEVRSFEEELAASTDTRHAVGVASGTDAISLGLLSMGIGSGDEVIVPGFTAFPTAAAVLQIGATPVLVDVGHDRPLLSLESALAAVTERTRAVIVVHLYGIAADAARFVDAFAPRGISVVEDCAQAQAATLPNGRPVGSVGAFGAYSFYPTKNLGALGDGGAIVTNDEALADEARAWRSHGERAERYLHELPARNSRLDDIQAAALRIRLRGLPDETERRRAISYRYESGFGAKVRYALHGDGGAPHLAVIRVDDPVAVAASLQARGIDTGRHYPRALADQPALGHVPTGDAAASRAWAASCLSLPLHRRLTDDDADRVVDAVLEAVVDATPRS